MRANYAVFAIASIMLFAHCSMIGGDKIGIKLPIKGYMRYSITNKDVVHCVVSTRYHSALADVPSHLRRDFSVKMEEDNRIDQSELVAVQSIDTKSMKEIKFTQINCKNIGVFRVNNEGNLVIQLIASNYEKILCNLFDVSSGCSLIKTFEIDNELKHLDSQWNYYYQGDFPRGKYGLDSEISQIEMIKNYLIVKTPKYISDGKRSTIMRWHYLIYDTFKNLVVFNNTSMDDSKINSTSLKFLGLECENKNIKEFRFAIFESYKDSAWDNDVKWQFKIGTVSIDNDIPKIHIGNSKTPLDEHEKKIDQKTSIIGYRGNLIYKKSELGLNLYKIINTELVPVVFSADDFKIRHISMDGDIYLAENINAIGSLAAYSVDQHKEIWRTSHLIDGGSDLYFYDNYMIDLGSGILIDIIKENEKLEQKRKQDLLFDLKNKELAKRKAKMLKDAIKNYKPNIRAAIMAQKILLGMSPQQVEYAWGPSNKSFEYKHGNRSVEIYYDKAILIFQNETLNKIISGDAAKKSYSFGRIFK